MVFQLFTDGSQASCHAIDWKHPNRGMAGQGLILAFSERSKAGPETFHAPSAKPADNEVLNMFFHMNSIHEKPPTMQAERNFNIQDAISGKMIKIIICDHDIIGIINVTEEKNRTNSVQKQDHS